MPRPANFTGAERDASPTRSSTARREGDGGPEGVLDEMISPEAGDFVSYEAQPYWPTPDPLPGEDAVHLAYVVAWQREVTPLENPDLLEPALGGIDTTTRWQTVWQVRLLADVGDDATCATPEAELAGWTELVAPSTARLTTATIDVEDPEDPCLVPPTDGYTGVENQLYRVEIHAVGDTQADARFKFSRENASVVTSIEAFGSADRGLRRPHRPRRQPEHQGRRLGRADRRPPRARPPLRPDAAGLGRPRRDPRDRVRGRDRRRPGRRRPHPLGRRRRHPRRPPQPPDPLGPVAASSGSPTTANGPTSTPRAPTA